MTTAKTGKELIWFEDPGALWRGYDRFVPTKTMTFAEQLNALVRLTTYVAATSLLFRRNALVLLVPLGVAALSFLLYRHDRGIHDTERLTMARAQRGRDPITGRPCVTPSPDNPFMNVLVSEYATDPRRPAACDLGRPSVARAAQRHFNHRLFRSIDDVFDKEASDRQFYTNPITTIPNDQTGFARWCYQTGKTCKEGDGIRCHANVPRRVAH